VNRVGDFGFALGIFAAFLLFNSVDYDTIFANAPTFVGKSFHFLSWNLDVLTVVCILLFMGAMGKSAQFLLHTWLPDAMEGPTPVSALIHAATMVTAGGLMVIGTLALTGFPLTAGYFSKDAIIEAAYGAINPVASYAWVLTVSAALMTAFYSWRLIFLTFHGPEREDHQVLDHVHESPNVM